MDPSAELVLRDLIGIVRACEPLDERRGLKIVGFHEIFERFAMVAQLGVDQPDKHVRVHLPIV